MDTIYLGAHVDASHSCLALAQAMASTVHINGNRSSIPPTSLALAQAMASPLHVNGNRSSALRMLQFANSLRHAACALGADGGGGQVPRTAMIKQDGKL